MLLKESGLFASTESMVTFIVPFMVFASTEPDTLVKVILPLWLLTSSSPLTPSTAISPFVLRRVSDVSGGTEITSSPRYGRCDLTVVAVDVEFALDAFHGDFPVCAAQGQRRVRWHGDHQFPSLRAVHAHGHDVVFFFHRETPRW